METVLITGGTGLIGTALTKALTGKGYHVIILTRKARAAAGNVSYKEWNPEAGHIDQAAIKEADHIIHLAGANVADKRWTVKRKKEIIDSRVKSGELLVSALKDIENKVRTVISSSAIGWYGPDPMTMDPTPFIESDKNGTDFLGLTCQLWEGAIEPVANLGKRLVILRTGIVLSTEGGAYAEFKKPLQFGIATALGSGKQIVSWIHIADVVLMYVRAIENNALQGIYNAVAPHPVSNKELITEMAKQRGKFYIPVPVPSFAIRLALGQMSVEVLKSATVSSKKIESAGFRFQYATISDAVRDLV